MGEMADLEVENSLLYWELGGWDGALERPPGGGAPSFVRKAAAPQEQRPEKNPDGWRTNPTKGLGLLVGQNDLWKSPRIWEPWTWVDRLGVVWRFEDMHSDHMRNLLSWLLRHSERFDDPGVVLDSPFYRALRKAESDRRRRECLKS